jgi:hypothetical protein
MKEIKMKTIKSDDQLIAEAVSKARARSANPNWVDAQTVHACLREVFGEKEQPADAVSRFMEKLCS